jgi:hypothetical protein
MGAGQSTRHTDYVHVLMTVDEQAHVHVKLVAYDLATRAHVQKIIRERLERLEQRAQIYAGNGLGALQSRDPRQHLPTYFALHTDDGAIRTNIHISRTLKELQNERDNMTVCIEA